MNFADRLAVAIRSSSCSGCVGLDPVLDKLPAHLQSHASPIAAIELFSQGVLDAVQGLVPVIKFQSACYERYGSQGTAALERLILRCKSMGFLALLDAKRGDIGITAQHYAHAAFSVMQADALTISGYLGPDTLEPFATSAAQHHAGLFILVRTSNPGSDAIQSWPLASGHTVAQMMAAHVKSLGDNHLGYTGLSAIGAVVAATKPADAAAMRLAMPNQWFLVPGYGAQGGTVDDLRNLVRPQTAAEASGVLVTASRSVIYPSANASSTQSGGAWTSAISNAAQRFRDEIAQIHAERPASPPA